MSAPKYPQIDTYFAYEFSSLLAGRTIASITSVTQSAENSGIGALVSGSQAISGTQVVVLWTGGSVGTTYLTKVIITTNTGATLEVDGEIQVISSNPATPTFTPRDIINFAAKNSGMLAQGQTLPQGQANDILIMLNAMLAQWAAKRWLVYHLVNVSGICTGKTSYTVGPNGDFPLATRPTGIEAAFVSQNLGQVNQIDTPLTILDSREDYNRIAMKQLVSFPYYLYYDNAFPMGVIYPWPAPNATLYGLTLTVKMPIGAFTSLSQDINLPAEYQEALIYNLAARLRPFYQLEPDASILGLAKASLATIRAVNTQIPLKQMPSTMGLGPRYNVYADTGG